MSLVERMLDARDAAYLLGGLAYYKLRGDTPERAYQGMVRMFCRTAGRSNDLISRGVSALYPPTPFARHDGVLGTFEIARRERITAALDRDGYYVFDQRLPDAICDRLVDIALRTPSVAQNAGGDRRDELIVYDRAAPRAVRYELRSQDLLADATVQDLLADWSILTVAQDYLRAAPIYDIVTMWWHTAFASSP